VVHRPEVLEAYAATLAAEIDSVATTIGGARTVRHIHWGGGTPTALPPASMRAVMRRLRERFDVARDAEIAVEIDPRTLDDEAQETIASIGTNRVSLGVQDFDPAVQDAINRHQSFGLTRKCADQLRAAGINAINLDLIYGLPYQTVRGVAETAAHALDLQPVRAAVFDYAHVPWMKKHQSLLPEHALPDALERFAQRHAIEETFLSHGYTAVGLDHYAQPDDTLATRPIRRNFQGYTTDDAPTLLGLGASSIGALPDGYAQNHASVAAWRDAVRNGLLPIARGIALTADDRTRRAIIEQLMCHFAVSLAEVPCDAEPALRAMEADSLLVRDGNDITITPLGRPFVRAVAAAFDTYLPRGVARHSVAV
jgi:oxygen-independent coproporphyrinogen-3 oxidase